jgi:molybdopterin synthase catalytic subunit
MNIQPFIDKIKQHPEYHRAGMILCHNGVVRETARDGRRVTGLKVAADHDKLSRVIAKNRKRPGIIEILVEIAENQTLSVGDDVMVLVVAGDIRENVISAFEDTLNEIKTTVTQKTQYYEK